MPRDGLPAPLQVAGKHNAAPVDLKGFPEALAAKQSTEHTPGSCLDYRHGETMER